MERGFTVKAEQRAKIVAANRARKWTDESRAKMAAAKRGKKPSPETRAKMSAAQLGRKASLETRAKLSMAIRGRKHTEESKAKMMGPNHHNWKGGRRLVAKGYVKRLCRDHPFADEMGYVMEHRLVMEARLKRFLRPEEVVHHINGIKDDNCDENLMLFPSGRDHTSFHNNAGPSEVTP